MAEFDDLYRQTCEASAADLKKSSEEVSRFFKDGLGRSKLDLDSIESSIRKLYELNTSVTILGLLKEMLGTNTTRQEVLVNVLYPVAASTSSPFGPVVVDLAALIMNAPVKQVERLLTATYDGGQMGSEKTLKLLESDKETLTCVSRSYFVGRGEILPTIEDGAIVTLPTRFHNISLHFQYDPGIEYPPLMFFTKSKGPRSA